MAAYFSRSAFFFNLSRHVEFLGSGDMLFRKGFFPGKEKGRGPRSKRFLDYNLLSPALYFSSIGARSQLQDHSPLPNPSLTTLSLAFLRSKEPYAPLRFPKSSTYTPFFFRLWRNHLGFSTLLHVTCPVHHHHLLFIISITPTISLHSTTRPQCLDLTIPSKKPKTWTPPLSY